MSDTLQVIERTRDFIGRRKPVTADIEASNLALQLQLEQIEAMGRLEALLVGLLDARTPTPAAPEPQPEAAPAEASEEPAKVEDPPAEAPPAKPAQPAKASRRNPKPVKTGGRRGKRNVG